MAVAITPFNPQTWNRYAYVGNNPLSFIDPLGLDPCHQDDDCPPPPPSYGDFWGSHPVIDPLRWELKIEPPDRGVTRCQPPYVCKAPLPKPAPPVVTATSPKQDKSKASGPVVPCIVGGMIDNFFGDDDKSATTVVVNIAGSAAKKIAPILLPGPGWLYTGAAVLYDTALITKSYVDCTH